MSIYKTMNDNALLKYLTKKERTIIAAIQRQEEYKDNEIIITLGNRNRDILTTEIGFVAIYILDEEGKEKKIAELPPGVIIGEQNFVIPVRRSATVKAIGKVKIIRYPYEDMIKLLRKEPLIAAKIFSAINTSLVEKVIRTINQLLNKEL